VSYHLCCNLNVCFTCSAIWIWPAQSIGAAVAFCCCCWNRFKYLYKKLAGRPKEVRWSIERNRTALTHIWRNAVGQVKTSSDVFDAPRRMFDVLGPDNGHWSLKIWRLAFGDYYYYYYVFAHLLCTIWLPKNLSILSLEITLDHTIPYLIPFRHSTNIIFPIFIHFLMFSGEGLRSVVSMSPSQRANVKCFGPL